MNNQEVLEADTSCQQLCTVVLSFLPYEAGKQQLDEEMPKIRHFHFINRYQRDNHLCPKNGSRGWGMV